MAPAMQHRQADVLVAGGGMVGLTAAVALAAAGLRVIVVDRTDPATATAAAFDGRASAVAAAGRRALEAVGVWAGIDAAAPILDIRVTDGRGPAFLHFDHREAGAGPMGWIVENRLIRRALLARAATLDTLLHLAPATLEEVVRGPAQVTATAVGPGGRHAVSAPLLVAADGRDSPLRAAAGIPVTSWRYRQHAIVCTVRHERPHAGIAHELFLPAGPFAVLPMTDADGAHRSSIVWTERSCRADAFLGLDDAAFSDELAARIGGFLGAVAVSGPRWRWPLGVLHADRYVARRMALVGDAAHAIHPLAGQGLNLGLRDAAALAEVVVDACRLGLDPGDGGTGRRYERWRRFDNTALMFATDGLNRLFCSDLAPLRLARGVGLAAVGRLPPLRRFFMRCAMGETGDLPALLRGEMP